VRVGETGESALRFARQGAVTAFYCGYVVSGTVERERLREAAEAAFRQLEETAHKG
jgi:hypothetical protein